MKIKRKFIVGSICVCLSFIVCDFFILPAEVLKPKNSVAEPEHQALIVTLSRPNMINDTTLFRVFYENWKTHAYNSCCSNDVAEVFLVVMEKFRQRKSWVVSRNKNGVQDYGFWWMVSSNAVNYLCNTPSIFPEEDFNRFNQGESKFFAVYATETNILGFRVISQKDVEKMPDLGRLSYMGISAFSGKHYSGYSNSNDHIILKSDVISQ